MSKIFKEIAFTLETCTVTRHHVSPHDVETSVPPTKRATTSKEIGDV
jgi:hypothetical protein